MSKQSEIFTVRPLLDAKGCLTEPAWCRKPFYQYDRAAIKAPWHRIKEWDYYAVISHDGKYALTLTLSDLSYASLIAVCWLDFNAAAFKQFDTIKFFTFGKTGFPPSTESGDLHYSDSDITMDFKVKDGKRILSVDVPGFVSPDGDKGLKGTVELTQNNKNESLTIATSWKEKPTAFYYNEKINCLPASGTVQLGDREFLFKPETSLACLDWGRGNWTYINRWYWGSLSAYIDGVPFGLNLGYGFSDRNPATENTIYYNGVNHKLHEVVFNFDEKDYMKPWTIEDNEGRLSLEFEPLVDRNSSVNFLLIASFQHQVFGYMSGKAVLDDGTEVILKRVLGFAEDVYNRW